MITRRPHTGAMVDALCDGRLADAAHGLCNVFEEALALPDTAAIEQVMREHRTLGCRMTGSGSAVYGLFDDREEVHRCILALRKRYDDVFEWPPLSPWAGGQIAAKKRPKRADFIGKF